MQSGTMYHIKQIVAHRARGAVYGHDMLCNTKRHKRENNYCYCQILFFSLNRIRTPKRIYSCMAHSGLGTISEE